MQYDSLELARIIGEPVDPRLPFPTIVTACSEVEFADPNEHVFFYDVLQTTEKVINISASGEIVQENVSPDTDAEITFTELSSPEFYVKITELASAKERTLARKKRDINRGLNSEEERRIVALLDASAIAEGNTHGLTSGQTKFRFDNLVDMVDDVHDYGDRYTLVHGNQIWQDIVLWDFDDNKFHSPREAVEDLGVDAMVRMPSAMQYQYADDGSAGGLTTTDVLGTNLAYLVAKESGSDGRKPLLWVRRRLEAMEKLGGSMITQDGERPSRWVFVTPNPTQVGTQRFLSVGMIGFESIAAVVRNPKAISKFERS